MHAGGDPGFDLACEGGFVGSVSRAATAAAAGSAGSAGAGAGKDFSTDEECARLLGSISAGDSDHGGVENGGMGEEEGFELGGGDLVRGHFYEVLLSRAENVG